MAKIQSIEPNIADLANGWLKSYKLDYKLEQESLNAEIDRAFTADGWSKESGDQFIEGTGMWCRPNAEATVKFTGTKVWLVGTIDPSHGPADVYIDGNKVASINTKSDKRKLQQRIFESDTLKEGKPCLIVAMRKM